MSLKILTLFGVLKGRTRLTVAKIKFNFQK